MHEFYYTSSYNPNPQRTMMCNNYFLMQTVCIDTCLKMGKTLTKIGLRVLRGVLYKSFGNIFVGVFTQSSPTSNGKAQGPSL